MGNTGFKILTIWWISAKYKIDKMLVDLAITFELGKHNSKRVSLENILYLEQGKMEANLFPSKLIKIY